MRYEFWNLVAVSTLREPKPFPELLRHLTNLDQCSLLPSAGPPIPARRNLPPRAAAEELLWGMLRPDFAAARPFPARAQGPGRRPFERGELVEVEFAPTEGRALCLVVANEFTIGSKGGALLVLQTIPYEPIHDGPPYDVDLVPLHPSLVNSRTIPPGLRSALSVDVRLLRGISKPEHVRRLPTPLRMTDDAFEREIVPRLEDYYAPSTT